MQASITSWQFSEWMAFYRLEPFGDERDDVRMARLATVICNTIFSTWTGEEGPFTEKDMLYEFKSERDDDDEDEESLEEARARTAQIWDASLSTRADADVQDV